MNDLIIHEIGDYSIYKRLNFQVFNNKTLQSVYFETEEEAVNYCLDNI